MIDRSELDFKAAEFDIHPANVQRDYVYGWILWAMFTQGRLKDRIFLKGGNALRKGYLADTRFSPDLDFGTPGEIAPDEVLREFSKACELIQSIAGVRFLSEAHRIGEWYPPQEARMTELRVYDLRLYFNDFYGNAEHINIRISIDFARYDRPLLPLQSVSLVHPYSDASLVVCKLHCMKLEEIIATKLKCLLQRQHAPDLFDYVYSIRRRGALLNRTELVTTFVRKTIFGRNPLFAKDLLIKLPLSFLRGAWKSSITCAKQIAIDLDDAVEFYLKDLTELFAGFSARPFKAFEYFGPELRNPIMQAGRELTCLSVTYDGITRLVEPYALKYMQRKGGLEREYFYGYDLTGGKSPPGMKSMVAQKLTSIENTDQKFEPRWPVELVKAGEIPEQHLFFGPNRPNRRK
jgi:predicted nucleotidyltransferase component of viral defense system